VNCFTIASEESIPRIYSCVDLNESFIPIPASFLLLNLGLDRGRIDKLLDSLLEIHNENTCKVQQPDFSLYLAIESAMKILEGAGSGGRVISFVSRIDNIGPGAHAA
jgi:hypothetical protein